MVPDHLFLKEDPSRRQELLQWVEQESPFIEARGSFGIPDHIKGNIDPLRTQWKMLFQHFAVWGALTTFLMLCETMGVSFYEHI